jgi:dephospho-CoA kinase
MQRGGPMLRVGLTGGIACGKSAVAAILREHGIPVIEADKLSHQLIAAGGAACAEVLHEFGAGVAGADGAIDRSKLGAIVFADAARLGRLNQILHPRVLQVQNAQLAECERQGAAVAVVEAALLYEAEYDRYLDRMVVCWCRSEQQIERLLARGLSREQAEKRIAAQMPLEEKVRRADDLIDCSGTLDETRRQTETLIAQWKTAGRG